MYQEPCLEFEKIPFSWTMSTPSEIKIAGKSFVTLFTGSLPSSKMTNPDLLKLIEDI